MRTDPRDGQFRSAPSLTPTCWRQRVSTHSWVGLLTIPGALPQSYATSKYTYTSTKKKKDKEEVSWEREKRKSQTVNRKERTNARENPLACLPHVIGRQSVEMSSGTFVLLSHNEKLEILPSAQKKVASSRLQRPRLVERKPLSRVRYEMKYPDVLHEILIFPSRQAASERDKNNNISSIKQISMCT